MLLRWGFVVIICALSVQGYAQQQDYYTPQDSAKKVAASVEMGAMTTLGNGTGFATYLAPSLSYRVSNRFRLNAGAMLVNGNYTNPYTGHWQSQSPFYRPMMQGLVYAQGQYRASNRLTLSGTLYKNLLSTAPPALYDGALSGKPGGYAFGFDYKMGDNSSIGLQFSSGNENYPFHAVPFRNYEMFPVVPGNRFTR